MTELNYDQLRAAVAGEFVAIRSSIELLPGGGESTKVMPPTYGVADGAVSKYALETRVNGDGEESKAVLLDSVASQANRMELALLEAWEYGEIEFPVAYVDFDAVGLNEIGRITTLEAPHRIADAIFRDSMLDGTLFRLSDAGQAITDATPRNATALLSYCPHALLFGMWDSTGPKGGLGAKFQRALVSEIVGFDAVPGVTVGSRLDPLEIRKGVPGIAELKDTERWEFTDKGSAAPSEINHGNVVPTIDSSAGGVTLSRAEQSVVISLPALRRLRFPVDVTGAAIEPSDRREAEVAARTLVAALGVAAIAYQYELDYDLRSRCLLIPAHPPKVEFVPRDGSEPTVVDVSREVAQRLVREAAAETARLGLGWIDEELVLQPAPKFVELIQRSQEIAKAETSPSDAEA